MRTPVSAPIPAAVLPTDVRWSAPLASGPIAHAVIADGHIFVALQSGSVVAHHAADGREVWRVELSAEQPLAAEGSLVFIAAGEAVHALRTADSAVAWRATTGTLAAPLLAQDGWIIAATKSQLMALRSTDGTIVWQRDFPLTTTRPSIEGDRLYVPRLDGRVHSLALATGVDRWTRRLGGAPTEVLAFADRVFVGASDRYFYALDARDGSIAFRYRVGAAMRGRPAADGTLVYAAALDNLVRGFDRQDGERKWQEGVPYRPIDGPLVIGSSVIISGPSRELPSFDVRTGTRKTTLALGATLAAPLTAGTIGGSPVLVALTGDGAVGWTLSVLEAPFGVRVAPLTALPGEVVPIRIPSPPK